MRRALVLASLLALVIVAPVDAKPKKPSPHADTLTTFVTVETPVVHVGDALIVSSSGDGIVTCYGAIPETGEIVWAYPFVGSYPTYVYDPIGVSQRWSENFVPLDGRCVLYQQNAVSGVPDEITSSPFSLLP